MKQKVDEEQFVANCLKVARAIIRLRHSVAADEEVNARVPQVEVAAKAAFAAGRAYELDVRALLEGPA